MLVATLAISVPFAFGQAAAPAKDTRPTTNETTGEVVILEKLEVTGIRESLAESLAVQKASSNLKSVLSATNIGALPDKNVADALSRVSGVSISTVGGEGRFVTIRGVEPGLNNVTMNGETLAASDTGGRTGRAAPLDVLSSASIGQMEVVKSVTPDMDGQSIGGTINIITPSAFNMVGRRLYGNAEYSINDRVSDGEAYGGDINFADRFGAQHQWGLFLAANYSTREYLNDDVQNRNRARNAAGFITPRNIRIQSEYGERERLGLTGNLEYQRLDGGKFYLRGYYTNNEDNQRRTGHRVDFSNTFTNRTEFTGSSPNTQWFHLSDRFQIERRVTQAVLGGEIPIGDNLSVSASVNLTNAVEEWPIRDTIQVASNSNNRLVNYDFSRPYFPMFDYGYGAGQFPTELNLWELNRFSTETSYVEEDTRSLRVDLTWKHEVFNRPTSFKIGVKALDRDKFVDDTAQRYDTTTPRPNFASVPQGAGAPLGINYSVYNGLGDFIDGQYRFGPTANIDAVTNYFLATRPTYVPFAPHSNSLWVYSLGGSVSASFEDDYRLNEEINAAYAMFDTDLSKNLKVLGGLRLERAKASVTSFTQVQAPGGVLAQDPSVGGSSHSVLLPNAQFRYQPRENLVARGAVTWTLSRPDYVAMSTNSILSFQDSNNNGVPEGSLTIGNPGLKPYEAVNFDVSLDYYLPNSGVLSLGFFHKDIKNAIYTYRDVLDNARFGTRTFETLSRTTVLNAAPGNITGWELTYQQNFNFLPHPLDGFGIAANYTITTSDVRSFTRTDEVTFFGQPDEIGNVQLYFQKWNWEARVGYHWQDDSLLTLGESPDFDTYMDKRTSIDFKTSYRINDRINVYAEIRNLTAEPVRSYEGRPGLPAFAGPSNQYYGVTYTAGLGWNY